MTFDTIAAFSLALLAWAMIPGPAVFAIIGRSMTSGFSSSLRLIAGILSGDLFYIAIVLFGMAAAGKLLGEFFVFIRIFGAAYLIYLGVRLWFNGRDLKEGTPEITGPDHLKTFLSGFSITLGNPKAILFHLGFLPAFFDLQTIGLAGAVSIITIFTAVLGSCLVGYAYAASRAAFLFRDSRKLRLLNRGAGTLLIGAGVGVAIRE